jgi:DNA-binding GntR family transcriptional regulator
MIVDNPLVNRVSVDIQRRSGPWCVIHGVNMAEAPEAADDNQGIRKEILRDKICDRLREWILNGTLKPGERIVEYTLARQLKVSRAPLREALWILSRQGLVRLEAHHSASVTKLTAKDAREILQIRQLLETHAALTVYANRSPASEQALRQALKALKSAATAKDMRAFSEADLTFHRTLAQLSGNHQLQEILGDLATRFFGYEQILEVPRGGNYRFDAMVKQHQRMVDLIFEGPPRAIESGFEEIFTEFQDYVSARFPEAG